MERTACFVSWKYGNQGTSVEFNTTFILTFLTYFLIPADMFICECCMKEETSTAYGFTLVPNAEMSQESVQPVYFWRRAENSGHKSLPRNAWSDAVNLIFVWSHSERVIWQSAGYFVGKAVPRWSMKQTARTARDRRTLRIRILNFIFIVAGQRLAKNVTAKMNTRATLEGLLDASFSIRSVS
jgi:hypothetical protein